MSPKRWPASDRRVTLLGPEGQNFVWTCGASSYPAYQCHFRRTAPISPSNPEPRSTKLDGSGVDDMPMDVSCCCSSRGRFCSSEAESRVAFGLGFGTARAVNVMFGLTASGVIVGSTN